MGAAVMLKMLLRLYEMKKDTKGATIARPQSAEWQEIKNEKSNHNFIALEEKKILFSTYEKQRILSSVYFMSKKKTHLEINCSLWLQNR